MHASILKHPLFSMPALYILFVILVFSQGKPSCFAENDTLAVGQALAVGDKLVSSNGKYALGFFNPNSSKSSGSGNISSPNWYIGIWFNKIPVFTAVWVANREKPITDPKLKQAQLKISRDGNLVISNRDTESTIWSTQIVNSTKTYAVLLDNGNLVMQSPSEVLWQSFDYPTDVFLPGAKIGWNKVTGLNRQFISRKNLIDLGLGSYCIELDTSGARGLILKHCISSVVYWSSGRYLGQIYARLPEVDPLYSGLINYTHVDNSEEEYYMYALTDESLTIFTSLDMSGQIKARVWLQSAQHWQEIYSQPMDPCIVHAACGPFTICSSRNGNLSCDCMDGFSVKAPRDWDLDDLTGGCMRKTPLDCSVEKNITSSTDKFQPMPAVTLPYDPDTIEATNVSECAEACANHCSCTAYSYGNNRCSVWHDELLNTAANTAGDSLYLRLAAIDFPSVSEKKKVPIVAVVTAASIISFGLVVFILFLIVRRNKRFGLPRNNTEDSGGIVAFRYSDLGHATKNFSEKLGGGAFGSVYKGVLSHSVTIAVKSLDGAYQGEKQFRAEVSSIGLIQHINLVRLIGFCCEGDKRLLVYEHMLNGSLDAHLFRSNAVGLDWSTRYRIALGVARGLSYLHESCRECIIHCDIKPENILLDASFCPKIADFGLAKFVGRDYSRVLTTFRGTLGYLAPEWISGVPITPKVDVYSFGMVLLEIISGMRNSSEQHRTSSYHLSYFPVRAVIKLQEGDVESLVDSRLQGDFNLEQAERICKVAIWCIQDNELNRPTMSEVVRVLEGIQELDMPQMPRLLAAIMDCSDAVSL